MKQPTPLTHQFGTPVKVAPKANKLYCLSYRGQVYVPGAAYAVCVAKRNELMRTGAFSKQYFTIKQKA